MENCSCKLNSKSTEQQEYVKSVDTPAWADNIESVGEPYGPRARIVAHFNDCDSKLHDTYIYFNNMNRAHEAMEWLQKMAEEGQFEVLCNAHKGALKQLENIGYNIVLLSIEALCWVPTGVPVDHSLSTLENQKRLYRMFAINTQKYPLMYKP